MSRATWDEMKRKADGDLAPRASGLPAGVALLDSQLALLVKVFQDRAQKIERKIEEAEGHEYDASRLRCEAADMEDEQVAAITEIEALCADLRRPIPDSVATWKPTMLDD